MAARRPTTIAAYLQAAPATAQPHLRTLHALLKRVAPDVQEAIKWGNPFFVEPRFLFAFSAHKAHVSFMPTVAARAAFDEELKSYPTTRHMLKVPYHSPLPEDLIRRMAEYCVRELREREGDSFW